MQPGAPQGGLSHIFKVRWKDISLMLTEYVYVPTMSHFWGFLMSQKAFMPGMRPLTWLSDWSLSQRIPVR